MSRPSVLPLVGRARELADLRAVVATTAAGTGGCHVLTGPPGIGKTRLLEAVSEQASTLDLAIATGRATELDRAAPLSTLLSALRRAVPEPVDLDRLQTHEGARFWYVDRIGEALEEYVAERPLLVTIDDTQWADELSALALRVLVPGLSSSPVGWLLARRPVPARSAANEAIDWLIAEGAGQTTLGPLGEDAVHRFCANLLAATPDATVLTLAARGAGNPFLLQQLLGALQSARQIVVSDGIATVVGDELPSSFLAAVDQRLRGLTPLARRLLQAGSVLGRPFTIHAAAKIMGVRAAELVAAAEEAVAAAVLCEQDTHIAFRHDLLREAVYNRISGPVRAAMHREAAEVVRDEGRSTIELADHLMRGGRAGERDAVDVLRAAATEVAGRAPGMAADLIVRALDLVGDDARGDLTAQAVGHLACAGRLVEARDLGEKALRDTLDPSTEATLLLGLAEALKHAGHNRGSVEYANRALATTSVPDSTRARLHAVAAHALLYVDDMPGAERAAVAAERLGAAAGEYSASVWASAARSIVARFEGRLGDALAHGSRAVETADRVAGEALHRHPRAWLGGALAALDRFTDAHTAYVIGRREAERLGTAWSQPLWHFLQASLSTWQGRLDEAVAEAEAGLRIADQLTARQLSVPLLGLLTRVAILRAQMSLAHDHVRGMQSLLGEGITAAPEDVAWSIAAYQEADGQAAVALTTLADAYRRLPTRSLLLSNDPGAAAALVRIAMKAGGREQAETTVAAARDLAARNPGVASIAAAADHAEGLLRGDRALLLRAVESFRASPRPLARASAMEDAAMAEQAAGRRDQAVGLLAAAHDECTAAGARRASMRLESRLRALGVRRRAAAPATSPTSSMGGLTLTPAEQGVADLVAEGLTNREVADRLFISRHTVDSHLRHIFAKLGVKSRVELTCQIMRHRP